MSYLFIILIDHQVSPSFVHLLFILFTDFLLLINRLTNGQDRVRRKDARSKEGDFVLYLVVFLINPGDWTGILIHLIGIKIHHVP